MIKGNLYFIKDEFFDKFPNQMLLTNKPTAKEYNMNRPCYYAFPDEEDERILWMVPVSSQIEKFEWKYNRSLEKYGQCDVLVVSNLKRTAEFPRFFDSYGLMFIRFYLKFNLVSFAFL